MPAEKVTTKSENRRSNKPLMEKRRRARINQSLSELKNLILDAMKKDTSRSSKLEKADILEMAVRHLQNLQLQKPTSVTATTTSDDDELGVHQNQHQQQNKYRAGYNECAKEVSRFLDTVDDIDSAVRGRLVAHLLNCLNEMSSTATTIDKGNNNNNNNNSRSACINDAKDDEDSGCCNVTDYGVSMDTEPSSSDDTSSSLSPVSSSVDDNGALPPHPVVSPSRPIHIHIPATSIPLSILSNGHHQERANSPKHTTVPVVSSPAAFQGLQLIPTRLSTGEFAFVVPNSQSCSPIPTTSATVSSSSSVPSLSSSSPIVQPQSSSEHSRVARVHHSRPSSSCNRSKRYKPIPLVMKDEPVWRPW